MSSVYFMQAGPGGPIKIGYCEDVLSRLSNIQSHNAAEIRLLGTFDGGVGEEARLHSRLDAYRIRGEWFFPSKDVLAAVPAQKGRPKPALSVVLTDDKPIAAPNSNIIADIEAFCAEAGIAESTFGRLAVNDGKLVRRLRSGGRMWPETLGRVRQFMERSTEEAA